MDLIGESGLLYTADYVCYSFVSDICTPVRFSAEDRNEARDSKFLRVIQYGLVNILKGWAAKIGTSSPLIGCSEPLARRQ